MGRVGGDDLIPTSQGSNSPAGANDPGAHKPDSLHAFTSGAVRDSECDIVQAFQVKDLSGLRRGGYVFGKLAEDAHHLLNLLLI